MQHADQPSSEQGSESKIRYSEQFLRERKRESKKTMLFGAILVSLTAAGIF
jgi:hypothetical protein